MDNFKLKYHKNWIVKLKKLIEFWKYNLLIRRAKQKFSNENTQEFILFHAYHKSQ